MANEEYVKETFKPDKLWACPSIVGSAFPNITPPEEGGGGGMYQIGEDLNFTPGSYFDYEIPAGTVNGDALYNAEYKAGAYVINKGYVFNYIGDSGNQHVFVNVRNAGALPSIGQVGVVPVDIVCEVLAFTKGTPPNPDGGSICIYVDMPSSSNESIKSNNTIKVNGLKFYSGDYIETLISTDIYQHELVFSYMESTQLEIYCKFVNTRRESYTENDDPYYYLPLITTGFATYDHTCMIDMVHFSRQSVGRVYFPTQTYNAIDLVTGEAFQITKQGAMRLLTDTVTKL